MTRVKITLALLFAAWLVSKCTSGPGCDCSCVRGKNSGCAFWSNHCRVCSNGCHVSCPSR